MISNKQRRMLAFIEDFVGENGYPPTYEEIRVGLNISSKSLVNYHLDALENAALLSRSPNTPRGIRLARESETVRVPVKTGQAELNPEDVIELTHDIVPAGAQLYALKIKQESIPDALLNEGDIVVVQPQNWAGNGELVLARIAGQRRLLFRRYFRENGHVRLQPEHPAAEPIFAGPDTVQVQGKVVAVIRQVD